MKVNYNVSAMIANNALQKNDKLLSESLGRLSSGLKIANAKDNPSGLAMSRRMNSQIEGLGVLSAKGSCERKGSCVWQVQARGYHSHREFPVGEGREGLSLRFCGLDIPDARGLQKIPFRQQDHLARVRVTGWARQEALEQHVS